jgi:hypothetical protein
MKKTVLPIHHSNSNHNQIHKCNRALVIILIFLVFWVGGSIVTFFLLTHQDDQSQSARLFQFVQSTAVQFSSQLLHHRMATLMPKRLPTMSAIESSTSTAKFKTKRFLNREKSRFFVYFDWSLSNSQFSFFNLKAFESALHAYPHAAFHIQGSALSVDSQQGDQNQYHCGDHYHASHFSVSRLQIYMDLDYDITAHCPLHPRLLFQWRQHKVHKYFAKYLRRDSDSKLPFHVRMLGQLLSLHSTGGLFSDFAFYLLSELPVSETSAGFYLNSFCFLRSPESEFWQVFRPNTFDSWEIPNCLTSTLLYFPQPKSPILQCVIDAYDSERFQTCLDSDSFFGGAECLRNALQQCFSEHQTRNLFQSSPAISTATNPQEDTTSKSSQESFVVLESFENDPILARHRLLIDANWTVLANARVVWLGWVALSSVTLTTPLDLTASLSTMTKEKRNRDLALITDAVQSDQGGNSTMSMNKVVSDSQDVSFTYPEVDWSFNSTKDSLLQSMLRRLTNEHALNSIGSEDLSHRLTTLNAAGRTAESFIAVNLSLLGLCGPLHAESLHNSSFPLHSSTCSLKIAQTAPLVVSLAPSAVVSSCRHCGASEFAILLQLYHWNLLHSSTLTVSSKRNKKPMIWVSKYHNDHSCFHVPMQELFHHRNHHIENLANCFPIAPSNVHIPPRAYVNKTARSVSTSEAWYRSVSPVLIDVNEDLISDPIVPQLLFPKGHTSSSSAILMLRHPVERFKLGYFRGVAKDDLRSENEIWSFLHGHESNEQLLSMKSFRHKTILLLRALLTHPRVISDVEVQSQLDDLLQSYALQYAQLQHSRANKDTLGHVSQHRIMKWLLDSIYFPSVLRYLRSHHLAVQEARSLLVVNSDLFMKPSMPVNRDIHQARETAMCHILRKSVLVKDDCTCSNYGWTYLRRQMEAGKQECTSWKTLFTKTKLPSSTRSATTPDDFPLQVSRSLSNYEPLELSPPMYQSLADFFRPFNLLLHRILLSSSAEDDVEDAMRLFFVNSTQHWVQSFSCNSSVAFTTVVSNMTQSCSVFASLLTGEGIPSGDHYHHPKEDIWFAQDDLEFEKFLTLQHLQLTGGLNKKNLLHHFLPQRESNEDSGFNTTLGMLNTF